MPKMTLRREVFQRLHAMEELRFFAVVADKWHVLEYVRQRNESDPDYHYHPNELYDFLIRRLFKERLHQSSRFQIFFSKRGNADRTAALRQDSKQPSRFAEQQKLISNASHHRPRRQASFVDHVLRLTYTAHDMAPFARDLGYRDIGLTARPRPGASSTGYNIIYRYLKAPQA